MSDHNEKNHDHDHSHAHTRFKGFETYSSNPLNSTRILDTNFTASDPANDHQGHHGNCGCGHDHHHHDAQTETPKREKLSQIFAKARDAITNRTAVLGASVAAAASTYFVSPDAIGLNIAAIAAGFYLMHQTSEYVMNDMSAFAKKTGFSAMTIGILSGLVHSLNEAAVSIDSVVHGNTDLALSAIISHQPFHTLGILGAVAAIAGVQKDPDQKSFLGIKFNAMNFLTVGTAALAGQVWAGELWGGIGAAMLAGGGVFLYSRVKDGTDCGHEHDGHVHGPACGHDHGHDHTDKEPNAIERYFERKVPRIYSGAKSALSLAALVGVSHFTVKNAILMTDDISLSPAQLGVVVAAGAALSEGYLSIRMALKKQSGFAFGNVMGCNITNTMLIGGGLGAASLAVNGLDALHIDAVSAWLSQNAEYLKDIRIPESLNPRTLSGAFHMGVFVGAPLLAAGMMASNGGKISKAQGAVLAGAFAAYLAGASYLGTPCHQHVYGDLVISHCPAPNEDEWMNNPKVKDLPVLELLPSE